LRWINSAPAVSRTIFQLGSPSRERVACAAVLSASLGCRNRSFLTALTSSFLREETIMRPKISRHGHDPRQVDLLAIIALVVVIVAAFRYFGGHSEPPSLSALIEPSQSVRW
jgi:hypothetical protein